MGYHHMPFCRLGFKSFYAKKLLTPADTAKKWGTQLGEGGGLKIQKFIGGSFISQNDHFTRG